MSDPKIFISYSWTTPEHQQWVLNLATELRDNRVDVILDKWDLREGHDVNAFMEKMVADPSISKVLLICDKAYKEKADKRAGGVGTEAQIVSPEIYKKREQSKFVAIVKERDTEDKPYLPVYYGSRYFIDLSDDSTYASNFEQLLRWIYDKPLHIRPELGKRPAFLSDTEGPHLGTTARWRQAVDAIKHGRDVADGAAAEYLTTFADSFEKLRITRTAGKEFDDDVIESIDSFVPYRNEFIEFMMTVARYRDTEAMRKNIHRFLEKIAIFSERPEHINSWQDGDFDNFRFILHEQFLYTIAVLLRAEKFVAVKYLLETPYYVPSMRGNRNDVTMDFSIFRRHLKSLEYRNQRLNLRRVSLHADLLKDRCTGISLNFRDLLQADLIMFVRNQNISGWWPQTSLYAGDERPFEVFARSKSNTYFQQVLTMLGYPTKAELVNHVEQLAANGRMPSWDYDRIDIRPLMAFEHLATSP